MPAATSRCNHRPRLSCCWKLPAAGQEAYPPERAEERKAECFHPCSYLCSSLILSFLLGHSISPSFPFSLSSFLLFLPLSSFYLFHILPSILSFPPNVQPQPWSIEWMGLSLPKRLQCLPVVKGWPQVVTSPSWLPGSLDVWASKSSEFHDTDS